jgi:signal transduction histidine kinase
MRERAESIGAQFALTSDAGGTRVSVRVPVSDLVPVS